MAVTKTNVFMDVTGVTFAYTPEGGSLTTTTFDEIEDVAHAFKGTKVEWSGDAAPGPMRKKVVNKVREVTLMGANGKVMASIPQGQFGTLTWIENDLYNGVLAGATTYVLTNFSFDDTDGGGKHNELKKYNAKGSAVWTLSGGVYTDPLTITQA